MHAADVTNTLKSNPFVIIQFWAPWSNVDRLYEPTLATIRKEFEGRIAFRSINIDELELEGFFREVNVTNIPALALFSHEKHAKTIHGMSRERELRKELQALLDEPSQ